MDLLTEVAWSLGYLHLEEYKRTVLAAYIEEAKAFMLSSGVHPEKMETEQAKAVMRVWVDMREKCQNPIQKDGLVLSLISQMK